jgi:hypothetical protein
MTTLPSIKAKRVGPAKRSSAGATSLVASRKGGVTSKRSTKLHGEDAKCLFAPHSPQMKALLEKSRQSIKEGKGLSHEEFWKAVKARRGKAK